MGSIACHVCSKEMPIEAAFCPHCGTQYPTLVEVAARRRRWRRWLFVILGIVVLIVLASYLDLFDWWDD